jgi:hypothetical protein
MRIVPVLSGAALILAIAAASPVAEPPATSLAEAIRAFNERASVDPVGKGEAPLTEEEVVAAIRWWDRDRKPALPEAPVPEALARRFLRIAEAREFPADASFETLTKFKPGGDYLFTIWSVRLVLPRGGGYSYDIEVRHRMVRSWTIDEELDRVSKEIADREAARGKVGPDAPGEYRQYEYRDKLRAAVAAKKERVGEKEKTEGK